MSLPNSNYTELLMERIHIYDHSPDRSIPATAVYFSGTGQTEILMQRRTITDCKPLVIQWKRERGKLRIPVSWSKGTVYSEAAVDKAVTTPLLDIDRRFDLTSKVIRMIAGGYVPGAILTGPGGVGKTYTVCNQLDEAEIEYTHLKGHVSPTGLYELLHDHRGPDEILVLDDSDSVFEHPVAVNWLKAALETERGARRLSWQSVAADKQDIPREFDFEGRIIFISNLPMDRMPQAIRSRVLMLDLSMTEAEIIERMRTIAYRLDDFEELDKEVIDETLDFLVQYKGVLKELSLRTLIKALSFRRADPSDPEWKDLVFFTS